MKKLLLVDDERAFSESLALLIKRELPDEFEVTGFAFTGREAIEKSSTLSPDIVIMDLRMPGISGLDAIREMRSRGALSVFILITAYERFDTALEAVTLGVADYLLKPVSKDRLFLSLRTAALAIDRRNELDRRIIEQRDREESLRALVEASFLQAIMLGERSPVELARYLSALGLEAGRALIGAASFLSPPAVNDSAGDARSQYDAFCRTIRYKSRALAGPLVSGHCAVFLPLQAGEEPEAAKAAIRSALEAAHGPEIARGRIRLVFGHPVEVRDSALAWAQAIRLLMGGAPPAGPEPRELAVPTAGIASGALNEEGPYDEDEAFLDAISDLSPERASLALERLCLPLVSLGPASEGLRFRMAALLGSAYRLLARREVIDAAEAEASFFLGDIVNAEDGQSLCLALRARLSALTEAIARNPRRSDPVQRAVGYIASNFDKQITLESTADALAISPNRLVRLLVAETGRGFSELLIERRLEKAKELLAKPGAVIKQVSLACGYADQNYFSRLFKKKTGLTPSGYAVEVARDEE
jgi:two-component system, response regulator YesN